MSNLKPWRQVVTPHADIRQGKFDASVFAADLGEVLAGRGAVDYRDAQTFFAKTYLTGGISQLAIDVMQRLSGKGRGEPVIQLQTPFGGGKTHTLLTLYHLFRNSDKIGKLPQIQNLVAAAGLKQIPERQSGLFGGHRHQRHLGSHLLGRVGLPAWRRQALQNGLQER